MTQPNYPWIASYPEHVQWDMEIPTKPLYSILDEAVAKYPDNVAISGLLGTLTYRELAEQVNRRVTFRAAFSALCHGKPRLGVVP